MSSRYLSSLSDSEAQHLKEKLFRMQEGFCYICSHKIDLALHTVNIDHVIPLANKGKDVEENFALTHEPCNKSKQDADLRIARILYKLKDIQDKVYAQSNRSASLEHVLEEYGGSRFPFRFKENDGTIEYSFDGTGNVDIFSATLFKDRLSKESSCFIEVPIEYLYHDAFINPRGINASISKLVKEFHKGNPQLHLSLARIEEGKIKIFDGQHKAAAQILLGAKSLPMRVFIKPDIDRLTETNTNAGSILRQIAFDKSIMRQLNNTLYNEKIKQYQRDHSLHEDDFNFSEANLVEYFRGEHANVKKYIIDSIKHSITYSTDNKLKDYVDFEGKAKELPISYNAFDKSYLQQFINNKLILNTKINFQVDTGHNPRELEINQIIRLMNIIAEEIYIDKFKPEIGVHRIENKIIENKDKEISDDHLIAFRMSKEEISSNWMSYVLWVIKHYMISLGRPYNEETLFQTAFDEQLWINIRCFIRNLARLSLWKNRSLASTTFSGKSTLEFWNKIFSTGNAPDGAPVLATSINYIEMIKGD